MVFIRDGSLRFFRRRQGCGCLSIPGSTLWLFFTLMYFFTEQEAIPAGKWEFVWRFFAGPFNFLF